MFFLSEENFFILDRFSFYTFSVGAVTAYGLQTSLFWMEAAAMP